jgi:folate-dependent phosphoribosylglycinamide formyltransferase PurN
MSLPAISCVYFGMAGAFSRPPLGALLRAGIAVRAVALPALPGLPGASVTSGTSGTDHDAPFTVLPPRPASSAGRRALPLLTPARDASADADTILRISAARDIPVLELRRLNDSRTIAALAAFAPDVICVACFSRRIPLAILRVPRLGCLNVHPSLLPANRGPDPLFWTFRNGDAETGVTIHVMDEGLDSGPIVAQRAIPVEEGISKAELEHICATVGGELLVEALRGLAEGRLAPQSQDARLATTYPWPSADDYVITPDRPARWAYAFARGVATREHLIRIAPPGATFRLVEPLGYNATATRGLGAPYRLVGDELALQCAPGVFSARVAP